VAIKPGDQVKSGTLAFRLDDLSRLLVKLQVSEVDIYRLQVGQAVTLTLEAVPGKEYHGVVIEVPAVGVVEEGVTSFVVQVEIRDPDSRVRPGMSASALIQVAEIRDALLIPTRAVRFVDGRRVVYLIRQGQPRAVEVRLGEASASEVQVLEGDLEEGDLIVLNPEALATAGRSLP